MILVPRSSRCQLALVVGSLLAFAGCSGEKPDAAAMADAIARTVGADLPADATVVAYRHQHGANGDAACSKLWVLQASSPMSGPKRPRDVTRARAPFISLQGIIEQVTDGKVVIKPAEVADCECIEWRFGRALCRLRQARTSDGWAIALEATEPN